MNKTIVLIIKVFIIWVVLGYILLLFGCAKTATETATDASLSQVDVLEQQIKKDCPTVNYDKQMNALRASINTQLATCESKIGELKERNNTLLAILFGLIALIVVVCWGKIKTRIIK